MLIVRGTTAGFSSRTAIACGAHGIHHAGVSQNRAGCCASGRLASGAGRPAAAANALAAAEN